MHRIKVFLILLLTLLITITASAKDSDKARNDIYSKLQCCSCDVSFDRCLCPEAKEMKAYISALLETGVDTQEILYKLAKKFSLNVITDKRIRETVEKRLINDAGEKRPQIILRPSFFDFGQVKKKQEKIRKVFKIYNKGISDLVITNIRTSCACLSASLNIGNNKSHYFGTSGVPSGWQAIIITGGSGELEIIIDLKHSSIKAGKLLREVYITSNDPVYPQLIVVVKAVVE